MGPSIILVRKAHPPSIPLRSHFLAHHGDAILRSNNFRSGSIRIRNGLFRAISRLTCRSWGMWWFSFNEVLWACPPAPLKIQLMAACLQAIVRGMFEDLRGYKLSYIAVQIKVRSPLQNKRKPLAASNCPTECPLMRHEQRAVVTIFTCAGTFCLLFSHEK